MKTKSSRSAASGFTLVELLVVLALIAIVAGLVMPSGPRVCSKGMQTKALSNAKQIALALRLYASDHGGKYPSFTTRDGDPTTTPVADSNAAFAQLFPTYVQQEAIFWLAKSAFCSTTPPDEVMDQTPMDKPVNTLKAGENEWAYVPQLTDSSSPAVPMVADGFANATAHTYAKDPTQKGGVWKGLKAVVIHADSSGIIANVDPASLMALGPNGGAAPGDIFTTANAGNGWLQPENIVVNPR